MSKTINYAQMVEMCRHYRGVMIEAMVQAESFMDTIIAGYFCKTDDKIFNEFKHILLSHQSFSLQLKVNAINYLSANFYKEIFNKFPHAKTYLDNLVTLRNDFAHRPFNFFDNIDLKESVVQVSKLHFTHLTTKDGKLISKKIPISPTKMRDYIDKIAYLNSYFAAILGDMVDKKNQNNSELNGA